MFNIETQYARLCLPIGVINLYECMDVCVMLAKIDPFQSTSFVCKTYPYQRDLGHN